MSGRTPTRWFLAGGLLIALAVAVLLSPFASGAPDGLEEVAEEEAFANDARDHDLADSPVAGYAVRGVDDERLSTGLAGLAGVLLTFGAGAVLFGVVARRRPAAPVGAGPRAPAR